MGRRATIAFAVALGLQAAAQDRGAFDFRAAWAEVVRAFHAGCEQAQVVGASLMFVRGTEVLGFEPHGFADRAQGRKVDRDTIYHWASITKTFTGIAAMQLRDRGRLRLDQAVLDFVPELMAVHSAHGSVAAVQVQHLLTHSAGFRGPTWPFGGDKDWHPHEPTEWSQIVAMLPYTEIEFAPGSRWSYSNLGIVFVGRAIAKLSGDDYEVYMDKNVLRPLGMLRSYFDTTPYHLAPQRAHSYRKQGQDLRDLGPDFDTGITVSNGGLNAPLDDMARYLAFLLGAVPADSAAGRVLARASLEEMQKPVLPIAGKARSGLTFFVDEVGGEPITTHTGGQREFVSVFYVHHPSGTGALAAFNTGTAGPVMKQMRDLCLERLSKPLRR